MQVSEFLGKKVLDKNAMEVGKVTDVDLMPMEGAISSITVSTGDMWLRNKSFEIKPSDISRVGDYVILNLEGTSIEPIVEEEKEKSEEKPKTRLTLTK